ncbi:uncharacterized protein LOC130590191 [Beta vulgaris subsp. vulgaris]|uniref:uncharacterized protein LOC130590191 n=1 Tax=Beta vulgaris subsp. vulgaris TaxID=3555 RepID=UPI002547F702|nr:uncharacterized protein LOC130590191 [Beta vulgaris subsp. vulgaris]
MVFVRIQPTTNGRIILAWNASSFHVNILAMSAQVIHCMVEVVSNKTKFFCTVVYAFNQAEKRGGLWKDLVDFESKVKLPWCLGDFNCMMNREERMGGNSREADLLPLRECVDKCGLSDLKSTGAFYTWNNKQEGEARVFSKLDRALCNEKWLEVFPTSEAWFMPEGLFDHSPIMVRVHKEIMQGNKPFMYYKMWSNAPDFQRRVREAWSLQVTGTTMFSVAQKLKNVKKEMKKLNKEGFDSIQIADAQPMRSC